MAINQILDFSELVRIYFRIILERTLLKSTRMGSDQFGRLAQGSFSTCSDGDFLLTVINSTKFQVLLKSFVWLLTFSPPWTEKTFPSLFFLSPFSYVVGSRLSLILYRSPCHLLACVI